LSNLPENVAEALALADAKPHGVLDPSWQLVVWQCVQLDS
jgi:hypothetical protein